MLVETGGTDHWISAGKAQGGMASSRSQLGADIHEIDNTASRCGRLLDEVAGDAEAVADRRDEIIAAMANTCKPYFGDIGEMTYLQWLQRYVELAIGDGNSTADTAAPGSPWLADTWRDRFAEMLKRAEARLHPKDFGPIETLFDLTMKRCWRSRQQAHHRAAGPLPRRRDHQAAPGRCAVLRPAVQDAGQAGQLRARHRQGRAPLVAQRLAVAGPRRPLRRRPGVHHPRHRRPSPASPGSTSRSANCWTASSRPSIDEVLASGAEPAAVVTRRQARNDVTGPLAVVLDAPDVLWAGRTAINPVHRIGEPAKWQVNAKPIVPHTLPRVRGWSCPATTTSR